MPGKGSKNHIHKYRRITVAGSEVYGCALPTCTHYMPKHMESLLLGKMSICWSCDEPFVLDSEALREEMPICLNCRSMEVPEMLKLTVNR